MKASRLREKQDYTFSSRISLFSAFLALCNLTFFETKNCFCTACLKSLATTTTKLTQVFALVAKILPILLHIQKNPCIIYLFIATILMTHYNLSAHNWQTWKRVFLPCPYHKIYRVEAVGLKSSNYTWKIMIFANMWNLGQFREKLIFFQ